MNKIRILALTVVMAVVLLVAAMTPAQAYNWSQEKSVKDCSANACIQINYNTDLDGTGMLLGGVKIYATGGLGTVGHGIKCWNENSVIKWQKTSGTNLAHGNSSLAWSIADIWSGAIKIVCRYDFDAEYVAGELPGQYAKATAVN